MSIATGERRVRVPLTNTKERYGRVAQAFHWTIALLFIAQYPLAIIATDVLPRETSEDVSLVATLFSWHKTIGVVIFALAVARVVWALTNPHPRLLNGEKRGEAFLAATIHWVLYAAILLMPLTGMVIHWASTGFAPLLIPFPEHVSFVPATEQVMKTAVTVHGVLAKVVLASIALHAAGALKHHFIDKDQTLVRMLPWRSPAIERVPPPSAQPSTPRTMGAAWGSLGVVVVAASLIGASGEAPEAGSQTVAAAPSAADAAVVAGADAADAWIIDPAASELAVTIQQLGSPVAGRFERWDGSITYDPEMPKNASVGITVELDSLILGTVSDQAKGPDFLATETGPTARFTASGFEPLGEGRFRAPGTLTLRGEEKPVALEFDLTIEGDAARATGGATLDRMEWGVGAQGYPDEASIGFDVTIDVEVSATRAGTPGS